jgi:TonB family protein
MPSKILLLVVLGLANLAAAARAEPASLFEIAPFCRSLLKARFVEQRGDTLIFEVERIYVADEPVKLLVPVSRWRPAWGQAREGFEGFFAYRNAEVDAVFPIAEDEVLIDSAGATSAKEGLPSSWAPLAEVEAKLAEVARRRDALALTISRSDRDPQEYQVVFTNHGSEPIAVNRGGRLEYRVFDARGKLLFRKVEPGRQAPDSVELQPGESTSVEAPAQLQAHVTEEPVQIKVIYANPQAGNEPSPWYGKQEAHLWTFQESLRSGPVLHGPAPSYTELARRARVEGEVRVSVAILPSGEVANAFVLAGQPMGLDAASLEAVNQWRFAPSETKREQEIVFEFKTAGDCDSEPPPFERLGDYRLRIWGQTCLRTERYP